MALYRDACRIKDMCFRDWKVGYKGFKDTSKTFRCYFASKCSHVISLITGLLKRKTNKIMHAYVIQSDFLWRQLKYKVHLCVNNTWRAKTKTLNKPSVCVCVCVVTVGQFWCFDDRHGPHVLTFRVRPVNKGMLPRQDEGQPLMQMMFSCDSAHEV